MRNLALVCVVVMAGLGAARAGDLKGHGGPIKALQISPDGTRVLSGSFDYSMISWNISGDTPDLLMRFLGHDAAVNAVAFTPDGARAVTGSDDGTVGLWDIGSGQLIRRFQGHKGKVVDIAVSPDGRTAASAAWDRTIGLWQLTEPYGSDLLTGHTNNVNTVTFSADGALLFSGGYDGTIRSWDVVRRRPLRTVLRYGWGVNTLEVLNQPDRLLFGALDGAVKLLNVGTGDITKDLGVHEGPVLSSAISKEKDLVATGGGDGRINVWSIAEWRVKFTFDNPVGPVWALDFLSDGKGMYFAGLDDVAFLWQMEPAKPFEPARGKFPRRFQVGSDVELGERQFARKCSICHTLTPDDANRAGPTLYNLFGRRAGTIPGYVYSKALTGSTIVWTAKTIGELFAQGPEHYTPGTKMPLQRIKSEKIRNALIAYLERATKGDRLEASEAQGVQ